MRDHPLFPPLDDDEDSPDIHSIHVTRFEDGGQPYCTYRFAPEELTELSQIGEMFGGGKYELIGRNEKHVIARRRYHLAGKPKPLEYGLPPSDEQRPQAAPVPQVVAAPSGGTGFDMLGLFTILSQQQAQQNQLMVQMMMNSTQQITAMATAMVNRDSDGNKAMLEAIQGVNSAAMQQQGQFFTAMMQNKASGGGMPWRDALELGKELGGAGAGVVDDDGGDPLASIAEIAKGLNTLGGLTGGGGAVDAPEVEP